MEPSLISISEGFFHSILRYFNQLSRRKNLKSKSKILILKDKSYSLISFNFFKRGMRR